MRRLVSMAVVVLALASALALCGAATARLERPDLAGGGRRRAAAEGGRAAAATSTSRRRRARFSSARRSIASTPSSTGAGPAAAIYEERHGWSYDGSSTSCLNTVYPPNAWFYTYWGGIGTSGHYLEERAHVTNCVFHVGDWKEFYPDVKIWIRADGSYTAATSN